MAFVLLLVVTAAIYIRPAETIPGLEGAPIYEVAIIGCLLFGGPRLAVELSPRSLARRPTTLCVLGVWFTAVVSQLARQNLTEAANVGEEVGKVVLYYLLCTTVPDSTRRLRMLMRCTVLMITVSASASLLEYHGLVELPGIQMSVERLEDPETGEVGEIGRLGGSGIFRDPNDFCLALTYSILLSAYELWSARSIVRWFWVVPIGVAGYAMFLTQSRGGLLGLFAALASFFWVRYGWKRMLVVGILLGGALIGAGGRQANFDLSNPDDTGQGRIHLWAESLALFDQYPLFGVGARELHERIGLVAHNSFIHAFSELGFLGGALFLGAFVWAGGRSLAVANGRLAASAELRRMGPVMFASVIGTTAGLMSLSRVYALPTYICLGVTASYLRLVMAEHPAVVVNGRLLGRCLLLGALFLLVVHLGVRALHV